MKKNLLKSHLNKLLEKGIEMLNYRILSNPNHQEFRIEFLRETTLSRILRKLGLKKTPELVWCLLKNERGTPFSSFFLSTAKEEIKRLIEHETKSQPVDWNVIPLNSIKDLE